MLLEVKKHQQKITSVLIYQNTDSVGFNLLKFLLFMKKE